jgi:hypothetical protein
MTRARASVASSRFEKSSTSELPSSRRGGVGRCRWLSSLRMSACSRRRDGKGGKSLGETVTTFRGTAQFYRSGVTSLGCAGVEECSLTGTCSRGHAVLPMSTAAGDAPDAMTENATIILTTLRPWFGNQQLGAFRVSVDGRNAGVLMPQGSLELSCAPGKHRLRARQWWYLSPMVEVDLASGETARFAVDIVRGPLFTRLLRLMFLPWRGVAITPVDA